LKPVLVLLYPLAIGSSATILMGVAGGLLAPDNLQSVWTVSFYLGFVLLTGVILLLLYGAVLILTIMRVMRDRKVTKTTLQIPLPLIVGLGLSFLSGFLITNYWASDPGDTLYFDSYGFPFYWRWEPTPTCQANIMRLSQPPNCVAGYSGEDFLIDAVPYTGLFLWTSYILILIYDTVLFGVRKWPFFLPRPSRGPSKVQPLAYGCERG